MSYAKFNCNADGGFDFRGGYCKYSSKSYLLEDADAKQIGRSAVLMANCDCGSGGGFAGKSGGKSARIRVDKNAGITPLDGGKIRLPKNLLLGMVLRYFSQNRIPFRTAPYRSAFGAI